MDYEYVELNDQLFAWCLEQKLYKEAPNFNSRMKNVYRGEKDVSVVAILAKEDNKACGIILCEVNHDKHQAYILKDSMRHNSAIEKKLPWHIHSLGFLSIYVKPEFRNKGIATELLKRMELWRISECSTFEPKDVCVFQVREKSYDLANKHFLYSYPTQLHSRSANYRAFLSNLTRAIEYHKLGFDVDRIVVREPYGLIEKKYKI